MGLSGQLAGGSTQPRYLLIADCHCVVALSTLEDCILIADVLTNLAR